MTKHINLMDVAVAGRNMYNRSGQRPQNRVVPAPARIPNAAPRGVNLDDPDMEAAVMSAEAAFGGGKRVAFAAGQYMLQRNVQTRRKAPRTQFVTLGNGTNVPFIDGDE